jgi:hypothetical protein
MFSYFTDNHKNDWFEPFNAFKYEQEMRQRQRKITKQRREREAQLVTWQRQKPEELRRHHAEELFRDHIQQKQDEGYQIVQDFDGHLDLVLANHQALQAQEKVSESTYPAYASECDGTKEAQADGMDRLSHQQTEPIDSSPLGRKQKEDNSQYNGKIVVEDVSDDEDEDAGTSLEQTLRNRRPSPGQWIEPVELIA